MGVGHMRLYLDLVSAFGQYSTSKVGSTGDTDMQEGYQVDHPCAYSLCSAISFTYCTMEHSDGTVKY